MQKVNNGFKECYYLTKDGRIYNSDTGNYLKADSKHCFKLKCENDTLKKITLRELYRKVFDELYCEDTIEDLEGEEWKPIKDTDNYYWISSKGRCKSKKKYKAILLKPYPNDRGYLRIDIVVNKQRQCKLVSRLVAAAFLVPPTDIDMQLHHKNGCKNDNAADNLQWLTPTQHRAEHKKMKEQKENA